MTDTTSVLVVGAGPTGMAVAGLLAKGGVDVRIVDAAPGIATGSRAILLWPPALEALADVGVLDAALREGYRAGAFVYHLGPGKVLRIPIAPDDAPLVIPQQQPGELLDAALRRLGCPVERPVRVVGLVVGEKSVIAQTQHADGSEGSIEADWLIGADGIRSTIREQLQVGFAGQDSVQRFLLAEGHLDGELDRGVVHYFLGQSGVAVLAPLPDGTVRFSSVLAEGETPTPELLNRMIAERASDGLAMPEPAVLTSFASTERIAERLRAGRCFLIGDAAHMHSAIGGQGLALGLQDARNLGWKLAGVVTGRLDPAVLDSYEPERRAAIEQTVRVTSRLARQAVLGPVAMRLRNGALQAMHALGVLERVNMPLLAGRRISYPDVLFGTAALPQPAGRGAPRSGRRLAAWAPAAGPVPGAQGPATGTADSACADAAPAAFGLVTTGSPASGLASAADAAAARSPFLHRAYLPGGRDAVVLVRPDGFVAASGSTVQDITTMEGLLRSLTTDPANGTAGPAG